MSPKGRVCAGCGARPTITRRQRFCFDCKPGGPHVPPPCRKCGSSTDYYTAGLCSRCHQYAPQPAGSCQDCHAWGVTRTHKWLCGGCLSWRQLQPTVAVCSSCGYERHVNNQQICRLCWRGGRVGRGRRERRDVEAANRYGQQLFFANMHGFRQNRGRAPTPTPAPDTPAAGRSRFSQLGLLDPDPIADSARRLGVDDPPDPSLAAIVDNLACDTGAQLGWSTTRIRKVRVAVRVLLGLQANPGLLILASDVDRLAAFDLPVRAIREMLDAAGLLDDDRTPAIEAWFDRQIAELPEPMVNELRTWFDISRHGSITPPRSRPRAEGTIRVRLLWARPILRSWAAAGHQSLREITRDHVTAALPAGSVPRVGAGRALRSIFGTLKARKVIFTNPTARMSLGLHDRPTPLPLDPEDLRAALNSPDPARAALTALIAFHGLKPAEIRNLQLADIHDGRLHLADRVVRLAEPVKTRLAAYLDHRAQRWPHTTNAHMFINARTGLTTAPVSRVWVNTTLGMSAQAIRQDRILDEATATGGDLRRICDLFGITVHAAVHYTATLNHPDLDT